MENFVLIKKKTGQLSKGGVCMRVMSKSSPVAVSSLQPPPLINSALLEIKQHLPPITFFKTRFSNQFSFLSQFTERSIVQKRNIGFPSRFTSPFLARFT